MARAAALPSAARTPSKKQPQRIQHRHIPRIRSGPTAGQVCFICIRLQEGSALSLSLSLSLSSSFSATPLTPLSGSCAAPASPSQHVLALMAAPLSDSLQLLPSSSKTPAATTSLRNAGAARFSQQHPHASHPRAVGQGGSGGGGKKVKAAAKEKTTRRRGSDSE